MANSEKVLRGIECCTINGLNCVECPYGNLKTPLDQCLDKLLMEARELIKEQEAVKPEVLIDTWICGNCKTRLERQTMIGVNVLINENYNYCPCCGGKVDWNK